MILLEDSQLELPLNPNLEIIQNLVKPDESNENSYKLFRDFICSKDNLISLVAVLKDWEETEKETTELTAAHALVQTMLSTVCDISIPIIQTESKLVWQRSSYFSFYLITQFLQIIACWSPK